MASDKFSPTETNGNGHSTTPLDNGMQEEDILTQKAEEVEEQVPFKEGIMDIPAKTVEAFGGDDLRARVF